MGVQNIWQWILIPIDAMGVWLLARPGDLINFWTARRAPASDVDRFVARVLGVIILWTQIAAWAAQARMSNAGPTLRWFLIAVALGALAFLGYHLLRLLATRPDRRLEIEKAKRHRIESESDEEARDRNAGTDGTFSRPAGNAGECPISNTSSAVSLHSESKISLNKLSLPSCCALLAL